MTNGKPIATDLQVLQGFAEPFMVDDLPRDERMAKRWGVSLRQVYVVWDKPRFGPWIESGVTLRSGWLSPEGKRRLAELEAKDSP